MSNIFISYRRGDSIATAGRIRDRLVQTFGRARVFVDVDDIPHGRDFVKILQDKVAECGVLLAIIGPGWLDTRDGQGRRRLDDPDDFVGIEVQSALQRESIAVIPVLVDGAKMPTIDELPDNLKALARRNAIELRNTQFGSDAERLVKSISVALGSGQTFPWGKAAAAGVGLLAVAGFVAWPYLQTGTVGPAANRGEVVALPSSAAAPGSAAPHASGIRESVPARPPEPVMAIQHKVANGLARLQQVLKPAEGRIDLRIAGGTRIALGQDIVFEVTAQTAGRLLMIDVSAGVEVTQIFPNAFVTGEFVDRVPAGRTIMVPGPGYGFTAFRASEPVGKGVLIAIVEPSSVAPDTLPLNREQVAKGFQPVNSPDAYIDQLISHVTAGLGDGGKGGPADWAFARVEYEIVR